MTNNHNSNKAKYVGLVKLVFNNHGLLYSDVYTSDDNDVYEYFQQIHNLRRTSKYDPDVNIKEIKTDKYYLLNACCGAYHVYIILKKPLTAATYAELINYCNNYIVDDIRKTSYYKCNMMVSRLKHKGLITSKYDIQLIYNFNKNPDIDNIFDYENYDITADELKDLFD